LRPHNQEERRWQADNRGERGGGNVRELTISLDFCANHMSTQSIAVNLDGGASRLVGSKCCGRWKEVEAWRVTPGQLREIAAELESYADMAEVSVESEVRE